ncbi:hypothetical protein DE146DRAFT_273510 [Phaeosphaeria sp. MPI-PUGE-AT-0046c]|nr:hypothetical protein DE146DRAFT_273510 [Phaeosphaeria sp. MPI-PUGE-AT-0046c]
MWSSETGTAELFLWLAMPLGLWIEMLSGLGGALAGCYARGRGVLITAARAHRLQLCEIESALQQCGMGGWSHVVDDKRGVRYIGRGWWQWGCVNHDALQDLAIRAKTN